MGKDLHVTQRLNFSTYLYTILTFEGFEDKGARVIRSQYEYKYREHYRDVSERMTQTTDRNIGRTEMYRNTKTHSNNSEIN